MDDIFYKSLLNKGLEKMGLVLTDAQTDLLLAFLNLLEKWNHAFNLTGVRDVRSMIGRHILDSLSIQAYLQGDRIIDVGTGAGLPGIPLSILFPEKHFVLLDSNQKKQIFVAQAVKLLSLKNIECVQGRVETYQPNQKFSTIVSRAFAPLDRMLPLTEHLLLEDGRVLAMLGKATPESHPLPPGYILNEFITLEVPGEQAERHLAIIGKKI